MKFMFSTDKEEIYLKVTMYNPTTKVVVKGVNVKFIPKWVNLGFEVKSYDSDKIVVLKAG